MTLQASGAISMANVAAELGVSATGLSLDAANVRGLAGVGSGAISLASLYGKLNAPPVNYTISFSYESNSAMLLCLPSGGYGTLTPGFSYKGQGIGAFYVFQGVIQMTTSVGFTFSTLTIAGIVFTAASGGGASNGSQRTWSWVGDFAADTYFPMILAG